jgi:hypothetical protein
MTKDVANTHTVAIVGTHARLVNVEVMYSARWNTSSGIRASSRRMPLPYLVFTAK